jgi:hypothetical protein
MWKSCASQAKIFSSCSTAFQRFGEKLEAIARERIEENRRHTVQTQNVPVDQFLAQD